MKICLIRNDRMGDMILTLPVVQGLKEANQDYKIDIVCSKKNQKICLIAVDTNVSILCLSVLFSDPDHLHKLFGHAIEPFF